MNTTTASGRKQLSDQLDRFDMILDGLSDGLNDAIADAARAGAHAAVQEILTGLLNDPQVRAALHPSTPEVAPTPTPTTPPKKAKPSLWLRLRRARTYVVNAGATAVRKVTAVVRRTLQPANMVLDMLRLTGNVKRTVGIALTIGATAGLLTVLAPGWLSAALTVFSSATTVVAVRIAVAVRSIVSQLQLA